MTLVLKEYEVCPQKNICLYSKDCKGTDSKRSNIFTCQFADDDPIKDEPRRLPIKVDLLKKMKPNFCSLKETS